MELLQNQILTCPYCWQQLDVLVDCSVSQQEYVEDCHVCCRPILVRMELIDDEAYIEAVPENY